MGSSEHRPARWRVACALALVALAAPSVSGQAVGGFQAWLWRYQGPPLSPRFAQALKAAGITGVCVDGDEDPEPTATLGIPFYLDHAAGKGILHLRDPDWTRCFSGYEKERTVAHLARPYPLLAGTTRARLAELVERRVGRAARFRPRAISLDDEISVTRFINPLDFCHDESSLRAFRAWLQARYGTVAGLRRAWGRDVPDFEAVVPPTTDEVRDRELASPWPGNLTDWNDHREFMDIALADTLAWTVERARRLAPGVPVGFEGGQPPSAFGGYDWSRLLAAVDFVEPYDIGGTRELVRSLKRSDTLHFETLFPEKDPTLSLRAVARLYDAAAHGLSGVILWSAGDFFDAADPDRLSGHGRLLASELPRVTGEGGRLLADATIFPGEIAILESQPSVRLHWMLDSRPDGRTWVRRFGSHEQTHSTSQAARRSWALLFQDLGYAFRFVTPEQIERDSWVSPRPRVLVLPSSLALGDRTLQAIVAFAEAGGLVLADETPARYDDTLRRRQQPPLDGFFGVRRESETRWLLQGQLREGAPRLESGLGLVESGLEPEGITIARRLGGTLGHVERSLDGAARPQQVGRDWCQFERSIGRGRAVLLNLAVTEYAGRRLVEGDARSCRDLRMRLRGLLDKHDLRETALCRVNGYPTVLERVLLAKDGRRILVVRANCLDSDALFRTLTARGPRPMRLVLPVAARVSDLWNGKLLGQGRELDVELDPLRGSFFLLDPL